MSEDQIDKSREQIFSHAVEIADAAQRAAYLDQACGDNAKLRAEVDELLRHDADAGSFLEKRPEELDAVAATSAATAAQNRLQPATDPTVVTGDEVGGEDRPDDVWRELLQPCDAADRLGRLGSYEIIELVGRGGMGVVLRAFDPKLNRIAAIKLLAPELAANSMAVRRFLREAQAAAAVSHDHVVTIYAIDEDARPPMIAMEMIDGQSLKQKIDRVGALDVRSILRIGMQTAAGLAAAHRQGLVHRDIKPANILLENGIERVKLTDFGLARAVDDIGMTRTGQITGTPQYMSPEQALGQRVDHRTDLFSLGCVLYAMCTGQAAFRADSAVAVMHRVVHDTPRQIRDINEDVPDWLSEIVDKLLEKNPNDRFANAEQVEDLLGRHLAHLQQPNSAPQPERVGPSAQQMRARAAGWDTDLPPETEKRLRFVRNVLGIFGFMSLIWFFANLFTRYYGFVMFGFTMPTLLLSLMTGSLALIGAWHTMHRRSFGWTLLGSIALLFPVNVPQMMGLFFTVWAATILWRDEVRAAFESEREYPHPASGPPVGQSVHNEANSVSATPMQAVTLGAWLARVPLPAWIAAVLFAAIYLLAAADGGQVISGRVAESYGALFFLMATVFVMGWLSVSIIRRLVAGQSRGRPGRIGLFPLTLFFGTVTLMTGAFVALWAGIEGTPWAYWAKADDIFKIDGVAPWEDFRWDGDTAYAQIGGAWYEVQSIQQIPPADVVTIADSKFTAPRRKVVEDLADVLVHMDRYSGRHVQLALRDIGRDDELTDRDRRVEMTADKRRKLMRAMYPKGPPYEGAPTSETGAPPTDVIRSDVEPIP